MERKIRRCYPPPPPLFWTWAGFIPDQEWEWELLLKAKELLAQGAKMQDSCVKQMLASKQQASYLDFLSENLVELVQQAIVNSCFEDVASQ